MFVYYSSVERAFINAATVVSVIALTKSHSQLVIAGGCAVLAAIYLWSSEPAAAAATAAADAQEKKDDNV